MEINPNYKNEPTVGMNFFENIPPVGKENDAIHWGDPIGLLKMTIRATRGRTIEEVETQNSLEKFQNRKPSPKKTRVVSCVKYGSVEKTVKLQNKSTVYSMKRTNLPTTKAQKVHLGMNRFRQVNEGSST
jgi:hypothetical protein